MLKDLGTEFKVGLFAVASATVLGLMLFVLNPAMLSKHDENEFYTILQDAAGIIAKTQVKTNGVNVGKVKSVDLLVNTTKVVFQVDASIKVPVGSKVEIRTRGLLGDVYIEIVRVADTGQFIEAGGLIPKSDEQTDMAGIMQLVGQIGKDVKKVTGVLANVMGTESGERSLQNILGNIETLTADLRKTGDTIRSAVGDNPEAVKNIVVNLDKSLASLRTFSSNLNEVLDEDNKERLNRIIASFDDSMIEVKGATKNIRLISEKIEKGEGTIGRLVNDDSTLDEIEGAVKDIREALGATNKMQIYVDGRTEARADKTSQTYLNVRLQTRPDRYYLIGMTDTQEALRDTVVESPETTPADGSRPASVKTRERITERKAIKFNLQMARRWYFFTARIGLFESSGGLAGDFHMFGDKLQLSFELFDIKTYDNEWRSVGRLKTYASILFFNHVYAMFGADDMTRKKNPMTYEEKKGPVPFAGAGITFNDQDLKSIFGAASLAR